MNHHDCRSCDSYRSPTGQIGGYRLRHYCELDLPGFPYAGTDCDCYCYAPGSDEEEDGQA